MPGLRPLQMSSSPPPLYCIAHVISFTMALRKLCDCTGWCVLRRDYKFCR